MSWKPMITAPKDGRVIVLYAKCPQEGPLGPAAIFHVFYDKSKGHWDPIFEDYPYMLNILKTLSPLGWIAVPDSSPLAGKKAYRDGEGSREPGKLNVY